MFFSGLSGYHTHVHRPSEHTHKYVQLKTNVKNKAFSWTGAAHAMMARESQGVPDHPGFRQILPWKAHNRKENICNNEAKIKQ